MNENPGKGFSAMKIAPISSVFKMIGSFIEINRLTRR
jgi:hypothetical protein